MAFGSLFRVVTLEGFRIGQKFILFSRECLSFFK